MTRALLAVLALTTLPTWAACSPSRATARVAGGAPTTRAPSAAPSAAPKSPASPRPAPAPDACGELDAEFQRLRAAGGLCARAADCACFPELRIDGARGISDGGTAGKLTALSNRYRAKHCPTIWAAGPPPPPCAPSCVDARCK